MEAVLTEGEPVDPQLDRIMYRSAAHAAPIPWPVGTAPEPVRAAGPLPKADVLIVTFTVAEGQALADTLTPGVLADSWMPYTDDFAAYEPFLTGRSPARFSKRLGSWCATNIAGRKVICFKSELHPAMDGPMLPLAKLWAQLVAAIQPSLVITTGTAGGVGEGTVLGDIAIASQVRWDCQRQFKSQQWANDAYPTSPLTPAQTAELAQIGPLLEPNASRLPSKWAPRAPHVWTGETTVTTDFFAMGDTTDSYGLLKVAPGCRAVEMDDAACGLALAGRTGTKWMSIRNASDPVMPGNEPLHEQSSDAAAIYKECGYTTTIGSAIACWAVISGH